MLCSITKSKVHHISKSGFSILTYLKASLLCLVMKYSILYNSTVVIVQKTVLLFVTSTDAVITAIQTERSPQYQPTSIQNSKRKHNSALIFPWLVRILLLLIVKPEIWKNKAIIVTCECFTFRSWQVQYNRIVVDTALSMTNNIITFIKFHLQHSK